MDDSRDYAGELAGTLRLRRRRDYAHAAPPRRARLAPASVSSERIIELDSVRGVAAVAILLYHAHPKYLPFGWAAVDLFFVLSGYLITAIILKNTAAPGFLASFYVRRGLRIWPIYYLLVLLLLLLHPLLPRPFDFSALPYHLAYLQNVPCHWTGKVAELAPYLKHTWTLAIEEQFYLLWPPLLLLFGTRRLVPLALACVASSVAARMLGVPPATLLGRADGLALGGLLAAILARGTPNPAASERLKLGLGLTAAASAVALLAIGCTVGLNLPFGPLPWPGLSLLAFNLLWLGTIGLVVLNAGRPGLAFLRRRRLCALGQSSYGLYLYHLVILLLARDVFQALGWRGLPLWREAPVWALCFLLARLSWRFVECPVLTLKDRFAYGPARAIAGSTSQEQPAEPSPTSSAA